MPNPPHAELVPVIAPLLRPGERILYLEKPNPATYALHAWFMAIVLTGLLLSMLSFVLGLTSANKNGTIFTNLAATGVIFGACLVAAVIVAIVRYFSAIKRIYAITDLRLMELVISDGEARVSKAWGELAPLHFVEITEDHGPGKVLIALNSKAQWMTALGYTGFLKEGLLGVDDPSAIADLIRSQRYAPDQVGEWASSVTTTPQSATSPLTPPSLQIPQAIGSELLEGEHVLWLGRPRPQEYRSAGSALFYFYNAFALLFCLGAFAFGLMSLLDGIRGEGKIGIGIPKSLFMVGFGGGIFVLSLYSLLRRIARRSLFSMYTLYAVTNVRALIVQPQPRDKLRATEPWIYNEFRSERIGPLKLIRKGTWGHLVLANKERPGDVSKEDIAFVAIENPEQVERLIKSLPWAAAAR